MRPLRESTPLPRRRRARYYRGSIEGVKLSTSLSEADVAVLDGHVRKAGLSSLRTGLDQPWTTLGDERQSR